MIIKKKLLKQKLKAIKSPRTHQLSANWRQRFEVNLEEERRHVENVYIERGIELARETRQKNVGNVYIKRTSGRQERWTKLECPIGPPFPVISNNQRQQNENVNKQKKEKQNQFGTQTNPA